MSSPDAPSPVAVPQRIAGFHEKPAHKSLCQRPIHTAKRRSRGRPLFSPIGPEKPRFARVPPPCPSARSAGPCGKRYALKESERRAASVSEEREAERRLTVFRTRCGPGTPNERRKGLWFFLSRRATRDERPDRCASGCDAFGPECAAFDDRTDWEMTYPRFGIPEGFMPIVFLRPAQKTP